MDFRYSPHGEGGGTLHLPSPTHHHSYSIDGFPSIRQLRRSLSRSPSKPSRFHMHAMGSESPVSPISPLALARAFSPKSTNDVAATISHPLSPLGTHITSPATKKGKFTLRRTAPFRSSPRNRTSPKSPARRPLGDSPHQGNTTPVSSRRNSQEESGPLKENTGTEPRPPSMRFGLDDGPIKFGFTRPKLDTSAPGANCLVPMKSSPLKRSDGIMNLDQATMDRPVAKRRSLHGASFGSDFDVFDYGLNMSHPDPSNTGDSDKEMSNYTASATPVKRVSPLRRSLSLRKSTLHNRYQPGAFRGKPSSDQVIDFSLSTPAPNKNRNRMSLDSSLAFNLSQTQSPLRKNVPAEFPQPTMSMRGGYTSHQPHPLSIALTPSSSASSLADESPTHAPAQPSMQAPPAPSRPGFTRSLPIGATRPLPPGFSAHRKSSEDASFATPEAYKMAKPLPSAFMSTGLISKRNRNVDVPPAGFAATYAMPDTPSKRVSFPPMKGTPLRSSFASSLQHEFGTPSTPFGFPAKNPSESFGKGVSIFGAQFQKSGGQRRDSFASIDGDDAAQSPSAHMDGQSSADELPPTPTKNADGKRSKENSLRSSLFGRRTTLAVDTFTPPTAVEIVPPRPTETPSPSGSARLSPHTPHDSYMPPDPSRLSISACNRRGSNPFSNSTNSAAAYPPATPTAPRDHTFFFGDSQANAAPITGVTQNDVDTELTARFQSVSLYGNGEFSKVYRVEKRVGESPISFSRSSSLGHVWAVKKTKKPYSGMKDRDRKLREVHILQSLGRHEHIIGLVDSWEAKGHLYIQTDFCENGNLKDFLTQTGYKGRLDDFRIWKILLELSLGVKNIHDSGFIHLDLKPANVFIDWEGVLKIGDFGLASTWPAPPDIDGEGDREYIGPEVLSGRFDKPADIFALGMIMLEIAGNIVLPDNGTSWQRLRAGDLSDLPSLTFSSASSLSRDESGDPITESFPSGSHETLCGSDLEDDTGKILRNLATQPRRPEGLVKPPNFMVDREDHEALDRIVQWMICPQPESRPVIDQIYHCGGVQWVEKRRRAGATIYEGNWGPADDVLCLETDVDMTDIN